MRPARTAGTEGRPPERGDRGRWVERDPWDRWWGHVEVREDGCWLWTSKLSGDRYPLHKVGGQWVRAHRWAWQEHHGLLLPPRWTLDHLCHTFDVWCPGGSGCWHTPCVRFLDHLEPLPPGGNTARRHARDRALKAVHGAWPLEAR